MISKFDREWAKRNILALAEGGIGAYFCADVVTLAVYSESCYRRLGIEPGLVWKKFERVISEIPPILNRNTDAATPSVFKRASAFTISFIQHSPLDQGFPATVFPRGLAEIGNHQNAIVAFEYCRQCLHGASYVLKETNTSASKVVLLKNKIRMSHHFYYDLIHAIANIRDDSPFHFLSLVYEGLAYKANDGASFRETI